MTELVNGVLWLTNPEQWHGSGSIPERLLEHLLFTLWGVGVAALIAVPAGYVIGHTGRGRIWVVALTGAARAIPTFGLLLFLVLMLGVAHRETAALVGMVLLALPPLLAGAYAGVHQVDRSLIDAATAQGMTPWQVFSRVELPLSVPLLLGGLRSAVLQVVSTVVLIAYVGLGGLGYDLIQAIPLRRIDQMVGSALLVVGLAIVLDVLLATLTRVVTPQGVRRTLVHRHRPS